MISRRDWIRKSALWVGGGLLVGEAAMEALERLTHAKVFALGGMEPFGEPLAARLLDPQHTLSAIWRKVQPQMAAALAARVDAEDGCDCKQNRAPLEIVEQTGMMPVQLRLGG